MAMAAKVSYISCLPSEYAPGNILDSQKLSNSVTLMHSFPGTPMTSTSPVTLAMTTSRQHKLDDNLHSIISKDFRDESTSRAILKLAKNFQTQWRLILMKKFFET